MNSLFMQSSLSRFRATRAGLLALFCAGGLRVLTRCSAALRLPPSLPLMSPFGLPSAGYPASPRWHVFAPAQLIRKLSRPAPPSELPCGSLSRPSPKVSIHPSGCLRQSLLRFAMVAHPRLHICLSPRSGRYRAGVLDLSQGLDSVKKVILPLKIVADPVPRKTERKIKICKRYIIECIGFCGDGASLMLSNYAVSYPI